MDEEGERSDRTGRSSKEIGRRVARVINERAPGDFPGGSSLQLTVYRFAVLSRNGRFVAVVEVIVISPRAPMV